ncbi:MAG: hypothetical protein H6773_03200 [Pseudomonadales bacterium]|nr:hypothetical protein [Candidatus Woesebacteria bacterium]MCB9801163.1 hypothetical protein [Pseudomonadales bacterium]
MNTAEKQILARRREKPFIVSDLHMHSMGESVFQYIEIKMHQLLRDENAEKYDEILVIGSYDRSVIVSEHEKDGKLTNWQRPTAEVFENKLILKCFPGKDYVRHYASLVASYFALQGKRSDHVSYILPTEKECWTAVDSLALETVEVTDAVVLGVELFNFTDENTIWQGDDEIFWATERLESGKQVTYLIVQFSFWADILYRIVHKIAKLGHKKVIFTAKLGGIAEDIIPNATLATGNTGYINGQFIKWKNVFEKSKSDLLMKGSHINSPSVLFEVSEWVNYFHKFTFVDSEVGYFALAAKEANLDFGYMHFVSNNLTKIHDEDLSNERSIEVLEKRKKLNAEIQRLIKEVI